MEWNKATPAAGYPDIICVSSHGFQNNAGPTQLKTESVL